MSLLVVLMCFARMAECTAMNAPLVIRKELTAAECEREVARIVGEAKAGHYANPIGGFYKLSCDPIEPKA